MKNTTINIVVKVLIFLAIASFYQCSSPSTTIPHNYTVRIQKNKWKHYDTLKINGVTAYRNGSALRGAVYKIETYLKKCPDDSIVKNLGTFVIFQDTLPGAPIEKIPIEDVDLVGIKKGVDLGINWFEQYNNPLDPLLITEVPIDTIPICDSTPPTQHTDLNCPCETFNFELGCKFTKCYPPYNLKKKTIRINNEIKECYCLNYDNNQNSTSILEEKKRRWYFFEFRGAYALYQDKLPNNLGFVNKSAITAEIAGGYRFGFRKQWGIGLSYFLGLPLINSSKITTINIDNNYKTIYRPTLFLHGRYSFDDIFCMIPFVYSQLGLAVDEASLELFGLSTYCSDCEREIKAKAPNATLPSSIPISFGFGAGIDIPLSCKYALSVDLGYKSIAFGEMPNYTNFGFYIPVQRRVDLVLLRFGLSM